MAAACAAEDQSEKVDYEGNDTFTLDYDDYEPTLKATFRYDFTRSNAG